MYSLFEIRKVLSLSKPGGEKSVNILLSAYSGVKDRSILALVCDNGYLLFRYVNANYNSPIVRQLCWFHSPEKQIKALSFDSSGFWLLIVTQDATIYILPIFSILENDAKVPSYWKIDNLTEIKLTGKRAPLTSVQWWQTHEGQHIAVIGSELGEISFINLMNKKEVGGTYITTGILALDILYDESHDTTYLLITGNNQQQWRLLLEERKSNFYWPFSAESELASHNVEKGIPVSDKAPITDEKSGGQKPHYLSKFESGTFLTPQCGGGKNLVSAYNSSSSLLQVLEGDLDQMHLFSYKIPPDCENIVLTDKLIFTTVRNQSSSSSSQQCSLKIFSRKYSEISSENSKKKDAQNSEVQKFAFHDEILALYKISNSQSQKNCDLCLNANEPCSTHSSESLEKVTSVKDDELNKSIENKNTPSFSFKKYDLEGCFIVQKDSVWECRLRISPEELFLSLTAVPSDLPLAEKLGVMLGLDLHKLYEIAADTQLCNGQFAQAVHLYQLSKCPQLKRVAHFMGYGFLSELIAYIQVLFSSKGVEIVSADKCHFANIALHCFAHQAKEKLQERNSIITAFKKFLKENSYYDEKVAAKLLAEQGLYDLAHYFSKVRGQQGLMVETLLSTQGIKTTIDENTYDVLYASDYQKVLQHFDNENYMKCMTSFHLLQFLAAKPSFLNMHLQHLITLLPRMDIDLLRRVAYLYDPSRKTAKLTFRNMVSSKGSERYWSINSLVTVSSEVIEINQKEEDMTTGEDIIKFFIFVLLMICHKLNSPKFSEDLIPYDTYNYKLDSSKSSSDEKSFEAVEPSRSPLSCGHAHVAVIQNGIVYTWGKTGSGRLGTEDLGLEYQAPQPVQTLLKLQVNVISVSCGVLHTLALTDCGIFGWGSSRYGQLGAGEVQQAVQPIIIESLFTEEISRIKCGQYHSLALTRDGRVYSWGWGIHGQLGHGNAEDLNKPKIITALLKKKIISISAGQGHSVLLDRNGDVYTFGCGMFGQLGTGSVLKQSLPQKVNIPESIEQIASGHFHVLALSRTNKLYTWGCNPQALRMQAQNSRRARQHGNILNQNSRSANQISAFYNSSLPQRSPHTDSTVQQNHLLPSLLNSSAITDSIEELSCGSHHSVVVTTCGEVYSWGRNSEGQIGNGTRKEQKVPSVVASLKEKKIVHVSCGADFTIVMDENGNIFGWGQNDSGQIGQKPSPEHSVKSTSGSSSGRVITIRTNRRMITITQPCRQSILHPTEIHLPRYDFKISELESGSFENDFSILKVVSPRKLNTSFSQNVADLSKLDDPPYGPYAVHAALKGFHRFCDSTTLLNHCLNFGNYQAAAKLCALENLYDQALEYQLKALVTHFTTNLNVQLVMYIIHFYTGVLDPDNIEISEKFLCHIIKFWMENKMPVSSAESYFKEYMHIFSYPLSLVMFSDKVHLLDSSVRQEFLSLLSSKFCLSIIYDILTNIQRGSHYMSFLDEIISLSNSSKLLNEIHASDALTAWDDTIPTERLWMDILRNIQSRATSISAILLSANDVDLLSKSLLNDKIYSQTFNNMPGTINKCSTGDCDTVVFSCGHHHTLAAFQNNILPSFKESMHSLSYSLPHTTKLLLSQYHANVISAACPKCVVAEINNDL